MKKRILLIWGLLIYAGGVYAQTNISVSGVVRDTEGAPVAGATVTVKDVPGLGAITDRDGHYTLRTTAYKVLVFEYLGMKKLEYQLKDKSETVDIVLEPAEANVLEDIVVTASGEQKKVTVTGAISTVKMSDLKTPTSSIANSLAGNVPGIMAMQRSGQPGENTAEFWIRGISTFGGSSAAMVMVDGFERSMDELNIEDIETFTVLKDAAATAIYGSRGANGVILITTKKGVDGKVEVSTKGEFTYSTRTTTPQFVDGTTYATMANEARVTRNQRPAFDDNELRMIRERLDPDVYPNVDWTKLLLKKGAPTYRASLNVKGGGSTARYYLSASYLNEGGMYNTDRAMNSYNTNANFERYNYRLNLDLNITSTTKVSVGIGGSFQKHSHSGYPEKRIWESLFGYTPVGVPVMYSNGYAPVQGSITYTEPWMVDDKDKEITVYIPNVWVLATQTGYQETWKNNIQTNVTLNQDFRFITPGLKFVGRFAFDTYNENIIRRIKIPALWSAERLRNADGEVVYRRDEEEQLMRQYSDGTGNRKDNLELELNYTRVINDHTLGGIVKYTHDNFVKTVNTGRDILQGVPKRHQGLAGNVYYRYANRYFLDFNFGYNGSENFAPRHRFGFFPAFSVAWNVAEEKFLKGRQWLNMFKIRASWGKVGTDNTTGVNNERPRFPFQPLFGNYVNNGTVTSSSLGDMQWNWADPGSTNSYFGMTYLRIASTNVSWEVATKRDVGIDLIMFNNRFDLTVDYFDETRVGIYMARHFLPATVGNQREAPTANVGRVRNRGVEGNFRYVQKMGEVQMTMRGNITYSKNRILEADEMVNRYPYLRNTGFRVDQARGLVALGLFKDWEDIRNSPRQKFGSAADVMPGDIKYKDVNGDGVIDDNDVVPIGTTTKPNLVYGVGLSFFWKGFDLSVHFQGVGKSSFCINGMGVWPFSATTAGWGNILKAIADADRWQEGANEDPNATFPRLSYRGNSNNYRPSTLWLRNGAYLRLKTVDIGYTLPQSVSRKIYLKNTRFYVVGQNVLTFSKFKLWDPEMGSSDGQKYPLARTWTFGISFNL